MTSAARRSSASRTAGSSLPVAQRRIADASGVAAGRGHERCSRAPIGMARAPDLRR